MCFALLRHKETNLHRLDNNELALQGDTIFAIMTSYDVTWRHLTRQPSSKYKSKYHYVGKIVGHHANSKILINKTILRIYTIIVKAKTLTKKNF